MTKLIAVVSVRTGIAPQALEECDPTMFTAILDVLHEQDRKAETAKRRR